MVYALKIMDKKFITKENKTAYVKLERIVLDQLDHPGIVRLFFTFQDTFSLCRYFWLQITASHKTHKAEETSPFFFSFFIFCLICLFDMVCLIVL